MVEFTTNCNLKCTYCAVSGKDWKHENLDKALLSRIIPEIMERKPHIVNIHGHGETTIIKDWHIYARDLIEAGVGVGLCSNLAKKFTEDELDVLSRVMHLAVSIDTIDPTLFEKLRRGATLQQVLDNLTTVQGLAAKRGKKLNVSLSIVCCDLTVWGLVELVKFGISIGISGFTFCNLGVIDTPEGGTDVQHVSELDVSDCRKVLQTLDEVRDLCEHHNCICDIKPGIMDTLNHKIEYGTTRYMVYG
jgi:MoaA/NifB/PqqE/SkfB family radical SAM enzyme